MDSYVQVGNMALRSPSGEYLPAVPLFIKGRDAKAKNETTGLSIAEEIALTDVTKLFAEKFRQYEKGTNKKTAGAGNKSKKSNGLPM